MAKTKISEFSATANSNTDINSINIAEGCAPSNINDAIRELMAELKDFQAGTKGDSFNGPVGTSTAAAGAFTTLSSTGNTTLGDASGDTVTINGTTTFANVNPTLSAGTANGILYLNGSKVATSGSALTFDGTTLGTAGLTVSTNRAQFKGNTTTGFTGGSIEIGYTGTVGIVNAYDRTASAYKDLQIYGNDIYNYVKGSNAIWDIAGIGEVMRLTSTGLGIGTSSPSEKLTVNGNIKLGTSGTTWIYGPATTGRSIYSNSDSTAYIIAYGSAYGGSNDAGLQFTAGTSNTMVFNASGNLGLGVTPSAWDSSFKAFQLNTTGALASTSNRTFVGQNWYDTAAGAKYLANGYALRYDQIGANGSHAWYIAGSGTAGNAITFTQAMTLDASGNLGIGTTSPGTRLHINGTSAAGGSINAQVQNGSYTVQLVVVGSSYNYAGASVNEGWLYTDSSNLTIGPYGAYAVKFVTNGSERVRITSGGDVGIGTTSPSAKLHVAGTVIIDNADANNELTFSGTQFTNVLSASTSGFQLGTTGAGYLAFLTSNSERARITSGGGLWVGTTTRQSTSNHAFIQVTESDWTANFQSNTSTAANALGTLIQYANVSPNSTGSLFLRCNDSITQRLDIRSNGGIANYSANDANLSDRREKTNFAPAGEYLSKICAIPVQTFNYIDQNLEEDAGLTLGVVAQDVQAVAPELVMESNWGTEENPKMRLSIYQTDLQYALMKSIQELKAELDSVKAELAQLKGA